MKNNRNIFDSFVDAFKGVWACIKAERNMRIHVVACVTVIIFGLGLGLSRGELACLFVTIGTVMASEAMNTSVEKLCDFSESHTNPRIRFIKDVAAGAVLLSAIAALFVGIALFFRRETWLLFVNIFTTPLYLCGAVVYAVLAVLFIIFTGRKK